MNVIQHYRLKSGEVVFDIFSDAVPAIGSTILYKTRTVGKPPEPRDFVVTGHDWMFDENVPMNQAFRVFVCVTEFTASPELEKE